MNTINRIYALPARVTFRAARLLLVLFTIPLFAGSCPPKDTSPDPPPDAPTPGSNRDIQRELQNEFDNAGNTATWLGIIALIAAIAGSGGSTSSTTTAP